MFLRITRQRAGALAALVACTLSGIAHAEPGTVKHPGRFLAVASDKTIGGYLERISWTNNYAYKWTVPKGYDYTILDVAQLNRYGELGTTKSYTEAVEHLLNSVHKKHLSNLGIEPVELAKDGEPQGAALVASVYNGNSTLVVRAWDIKGSTDAVSPGAAARQ